MRLSLTAKFIVGNADLRKTQFVYPSCTLFSSNTDATGICLAFRKRWRVTHSRHVPARNHWNPGSYPGVGDIPKVVDGGLVCLAVSNFVGQFSLSMLSWFV